MKEDICTRRAIYPLHQVWNILPATTSWNSQRIMYGGGERPDHHFTRQFSDYGVPLAVLLIERPHRPMDPEIEESGRTCQLYNDVAVSDDDDVAVSDDDDDEEAKQMVVSDALFTHLFDMVQRPKPQFIVKRSVTRKRRPKT